jgi:UDP-glucose 4-epimerase
VSILGERYSHGHVFDFYRSLRADPRELRVLGNGRQRKSYLYVQDCIDAVLTAIENAHDKVNILNLGTAEYCEVNDSIGWITSHLGIDPVRTYSGGERGWIGDSPFILLDASRMRSLGWMPKVTIKDGIIRTLDYLRENPWLLDPQP